MIRYLLSLIAAIASLSVWANTVTLSKASGHPTDEVVLILSMTGSEAVTALEAVIPLGDYLSYVEGSAALNASRSNGHQISAAVKDGSLHIYAYNLALENFKGSSGELLSFKLSLGQSSGQQPLSPNVVLSNSAGARVEASVTSGSVNILSPMLNILTQEIDFGHVPIHSTYEATLTLQNTGNEPLRITGITADDAELSILPSSMTIQAGRSGNFTVKYSPIKRNDFAAKIIIESDAVNAKRYGKWLSAEVVADPFSVNEVYVNQVSGVSDSEVEVSLRLDNMEPIVAAEVTFALPEALVYVEGSAKVTSRGVDHKALASVNDGNLRLLAYSSTNTALKGNNGEYLTFRLRLNGRSGWYWLQPDKVILSNVSMENMVSAVYGEYVVIQSPTIYGDLTLDFDQQSFLSNIKASYTLGNSGQSELVIDKVTFLSEGFRVDTPLPIKIKPYESSQINISYSPVECGDFSSTMNIYSNDPEQRMFQVDVKGRAYSPNELSLSGEIADRKYQLLVGLENHSPVTAVQFDIDVKPSSAVNGTPTVSPSDRIDKFTYGVYELGDGKWRLLVYSMSNEEIDGNVGELLKLQFNPTDVNQEVVFTLSNSVISMKDGVNVESPKLTATRNVSFIVPTSLSFEFDTLELTPGDEITLSPIITPNEIRDCALTWTSSSPEVATVDTAGKIRALSGGSTTITVKSWNGLTASCVVTVAKMRQQIVWEQDFDDVYEGDQIVLEAYATSGLDVVYQITVGSDIASIDGNTLTVKSSGVIEIKATQPGDSKFMEAAAVTKTLTAMAGIGVVKADSFKYSIEGSELVLDGETEISIWTSSGVLVYRGKCDRINLEKNVLYILQAGLQVHKVLVK